MTRLRLLALAAVAIVITLIVSLQPQSAERAAASLPVFAPPPRAPDLSPPDVERVSPPQTNASPSEMALAAWRQIERRHAARPLGESAARDASLQRLDSYFGGVTKGLFDTPTLRHLAPASTQLDCRDRSCTVRLTFAGYPHALAFADDLQEGRFKLLFHASLHLECPLKSVTVPYVGSGPAAALLWFACD